MIIGLIIFCIVLLVYSAIVGTVLLKHLKNNKNMENQTEKNEEQTLPVEPTDTTGVSQTVEDSPKNNMVDGPLRFVIEIPKKIDNGEDAPPLLMDLKDSSQTTSTLLSVFDGMGGAGSEKVTLHDGSEKTNAYIGSRATRQLVEQFFSATIETEIPIEQQLKTTIQNGLKEKNRELEAFGSSTRSKLVSTLHKKLPTTMALLWYRYTPGHDLLQLTTLWAGDSRCYALSPQKGLLQLTKDDNGTDDAMLALMQSPQMTNSISASHEFKINRRDYEMGMPCMLFAASDGVFDYLPSPLLVEYNILNTLQLSSSVAEWRNRLQVILDVWKQDDVSMALDLPGFKDFDEVKRAFSPRYELLKTNYKDVVEKADECTQVLLQKKKMQEEIVKYKEQKQTIDVGIQTIETEIVILSQKMEVIKKLINDYKQQIAQLEARLRSEESNNYSCKKEMEEKASAKGAKEDERIPWDKKIAELEQSIRDLNYDQLLNDLRQKAVLLWKETGYKSSYEEMLLLEQIDMNN